MIEMLAANRKYAKWFDYQMRDHPTIHYDSIGQKQEVVEFSYAVRFAVCNDRKLR